MAPVKSKGKKKIVKLKESTIDTVIPVSTPVGSVHFDEFLKICRQPQTLAVAVEPEKTPEPGKNEKKSDRSKKKKKKKTGGKKNAPSKKVVEQPDDVAPPDETDSTRPQLFPLNNALLLRQNDRAPPDAEQTLFPEFVVGENTRRPIFCKRQMSMREIDAVEQQANRMVDEISKAQESLKVLTEKPKLNRFETIKLEEQQLLFMDLLNEFENCMDKIRDIFNKEQSDNGVVNDAVDDDWVDINVKDEMSDKKPSSEKTDEVNIRKMDVVKWYESIDLACLLSPNSSFNKHDSVPSSMVIKIFDKLKIENVGQRKNAKREELYERLRNKFAVLLPPPKIKASKDDWIWMCKKFHKDHKDMLNATKDLKIYQCGYQLELKYNVINALIISLKDAIKSTSPFYYSSKDVKAKFVSDQCDIIQALDEIKHMTNRTFLPAGLEYFWKIHPQSIRLGAKPSYDVYIHQKMSDMDDAISFDDLELSFLKHNSLETMTKDITKSKNPKTSEVEVKTVNYSN